MSDSLADRAVQQGEDPEMSALLAEVCELTGMGFAAIARVTEDRWVACQVLDRIEFGLNAGDELEISTTICNDIRQSGAAVVIDEVAGHPDWRTHPTPILYGFESYASFPIIMDDGSFFGTLCAIDPKPRLIDTPRIFDAMKGLASRAARLLTQR